MGKPCRGVILSLWPFISRIHPVTNLFVLEKAGFIETKRTRAVNQYLLRLFVAKMLEDQFLVTTDLDAGSRYKLKSTEMLDFVNRIKYSVPEYETLFADCTRMVGMRHLPEFVSLALNGHDIVITWNNK